MPELFVKSPAITLTSTLLAEPVEFRVHSASVTALTAPTRNVSKNIPKTNDENILFFICSHFGVTNVYKYFYSLEYTFF